MNNYIINEVDEFRLVGTKLTRNIFDDPFVKRFIRKQFIHCEADFMNAITLWPV